MEKKTDIIYLLGMPGCGKTFWGNKIATLLNSTFVDLDEAIEHSEQKTIASVFETEGENYFREKEHFVLKNIARVIEKPCVVSVGGGTPCFYDNMHYMKQTGITIYLKATITTLAHQLQTDKKIRPLLQQHTKSLKQSLTDLLLERTVFYEQADHIFEVEKLKIEQLKKIIL